MTMTKKIIFALFFGSFWVAGSALAQPPAGASSLAPATNSESSKKDVHDDKREELKTKLLKRKMELDVERIQTTTTKSTERQLIRPENARAQAAPAPKAKENKEKK